MTNGYEVRPYRPGDESEIVQLLQLVFDGWPNFDLSCPSIDHWRWKYLDNPLKRSYVTVGVSRGDIVGVNHAFTLNVKIGGRTFFCGYASDTAVHPEFRGMGLSGKIIELKNQFEISAGVHLNLSVTSNPIMLGYQKRNPTMDPFPHEVVNLVKINDIGLQIRNIPVKNPLYMRLGFNAAKLINNIRNLTRTKRAPTKNLEIKTIQAFDERFERFWREISRCHDFIVERGREYLNWRYCDPRAGNFVVRKVDDDDGNVLGYSVLALNRSLRDYPIGYLIDLVTLPERNDVAEALVADAVDHFDLQQVNIVNCLMPRRHPNVGILMKYGFLNSRITLKLFCKYFVMGEAKEGISTLSGNRIHFSYGDIDSLPASARGM